MFSSLTRIFKFAIQNFWRNIWLSLVTVTMLVLTLLVVNILISLQVMGQAARREVEKKIDLTVGFKPGVSEKVVTEVQSYLGSLSQVVAVEEISATEALESFRRRHQNNPAVLISLEEVGGNPFGPSLVVRARGSQDYPFILEALENPTYREYVQDKDFIDHELVISRINTIVSRFRNFGVALAGIFAIIAVLIIFNTIRVAIYTYREEIGIMKLVGASNWFVRLPFLLESVFYSLLAVGLTAVIVFPAATFLEPVLTRFFDGETVGLVAYFKLHGLGIFSSQLLALIFLNIVSSLLAMGRYLRT